MKNNDIIKLDQELLIASSSFWCEKSEKGNSNYHLSKDLINEHSGVPIQIIISAIKKGIVKNGNKEFVLCFQQISIWINDYSMFSSKNN